jgi:uncharacterized membrane protein (UPF0182 family)
MAEAFGSWRRLSGWSALLLVVYGVLAGPSFYGEFLWFAAQGYGDVFLVMFGYRVGLFLLTGAISFAVFYATFRVANTNLADIGAADPPWTYRAAVVAGAVVIGLLQAGAWDTVLRFLHATPFGVTDPVFGRDVAFYVYTLPVLNFLIDFLQLVVVAGFALALALYVRPFVTTGETGAGPVVEAARQGGQQVSIDPAATFTFVREHAYGHVVAYIGAFLLLAGAEFFVDRYELLFSQRGVVFGMGATDQAVFLPLLGLLAITAALGGVVVLANIRWPDARAVYIPIALIIGFMLLGNLAGFAYQDFVVEPDEFNKEQQYIEQEIEFTNQAFALDRVDEQQFPVNDTLTRDQIEDNPGTVDNVRLWDPRPLLTTYNELQIFRTYYQFTDVDIDRYEVDGQKRQVMVSAREIEFEALPEESRTWVNRHLVYTHGFGVAMSPVSEVTADGLPKFYLKDIPPNATAGIEVTQPRIYYGEATTDFAILDTRTRELDYPQGGQNVYTTYDGGGGVQLSSTLRELVYTIKFQDPRIILSDSVTSESRLQFKRDIQTRAPTIAPFLEYDRDPYVVVSDGELYWIYDAYTTSDQFPYSDRVRFKGDRENYVRNSVKVVVDAYTGETTYYVAEPDDPLIRTYRKAFPGLFVDIEEMPADLRKHVRYPEDAFRVQAHQYLDYHMRDPNVFYNKEDAWRIPKEVSRGEEAPMDPYYIILKFPGEERPEFVMIQPYIPEGRENMIGWLGARSDPPNYGSLKAFLFSKQRLIFGPMQVESRIDQDADISQQITLWSESGSSVIRGNLLAIPIDDTVIYVEPLFLESREAGRLPELKRVILTQGDNVVMQPTLQEAVAVQVGAARPAQPGTAAGLSPAQLDRARTLYEEAQAALREGDFETYGRKITQLGELLREADPASGNTTAG